MGTPSTNSKPKPRRKWVLKPKVYQERGVVKLVNVPHGFYENEMYKFFSQFGRVTRLRLVRSRKTSRSKGVAFIEFMYKDVAEIVADAMNNYLVYDSLLKCEVVHKRKVHPFIFKNWNLKIVSTRTQHKDAINRDRCKKKIRQMIKRKMSEINKSEETLKRLGINFKCIAIEDETSEGDVTGEDVGFNDIKPNSTERRSALPITRSRLMKLPKFVNLRRAVPEFHL